MSNENTMRIIICGGRHFDDYEYLKASCDSVISQIGTDKGIEIVSGHCKGCDMLGEKYAEERGYKLTVFPAEWKKYGKSAGIKRNIRMLEYIEVPDSAVIGFVSENTKGTRFTVKEAERNGIATYVFEYTPGKKEKTSVKEIPDSEYEGIVDRAFSSAAMKKFYKKKENRLTKHGIAEVVIGTPEMNIYEKYEILKKLAGTADGDLYEKLNNYAEDFENAIDGLHNCREGEIFIVHDEWPDNECRNIERGSSWPSANFENLLKTIALDEIEEETNAQSLTWDVIEKWAPDGSGGFIQKCTYYHIYKKGICWFAPFIPEEDRDNRDYSFECSQLNLETPFRTGDIVRIDCTPFAPPLTALIVYNGEPWDCCSILALYYDDGKYDCGAVKHADFWLRKYDFPIVSPLYRLHKFTGRLGENEETYREISALIKGDNKKGDKVWEIVNKEEIGTPEELMKKVKELNL